jgi:hypothetical protein
MCLLQGFTKDTYLHIGIYNGYLARTSQAPVESSFKRMRMAQYLAEKFEIEINFR